MGWAYAILLALLSQDDIITKAYVWEEALAEHLLACANRALNLPDRKRSRHSDGIRDILITSLSGLSGETKKN